MAGMESKSFPISLRPWPKDEDDSKTESLEQMIFRIHTQRKHFRHVTEEQLQKEIVDEQNGVAQDDDLDSEPETKDEDEKGNHKFIAKKRHEMTNYLLQAIQEAAIALDAVSLLESKYLPTPAKTTLLPHLTAHVPAGSLSYDKWNIPRQDPRAKEDERLVSKGRTMENLTSIADSLLSAATRLEKDVKRETEYWGQVLSLTDNGWPVFKLQGDQRILGVQFGAAEAGPMYRDRGFAALRANEDGSIKLDQRLAMEPKTLRVRLMENGKVVSNSLSRSLPFLGETDTSLEAVVRRAQDSLFEEELFHEMVMESRLLQPLGVKLRADIIHVPITTAQNEGSPSEYLIDLVPLNSLRGGLLDTGKKSALDSYVVAFRLFLCHAYRHRLQRRSELPPPLSERRRTDVVSSIIRPVMAFSQHHRASRALQIFLSKIRENLKAAGVSIHSDISELPSNLTSLKSPSKHSSTLDTLLDRLNHPWKTSATVIAASWQESDIDFTASEGQLTLEVHTNLSPPLCGTEFTLSLSKGLSDLIRGNDMQPELLTFRSFPELKSYVCEVLAFDIARNMLSLQHRNWKPALFLPAIWKTSELKENKPRVAIEVLVGSDRVEARKQYLAEDEEVGTQILNRETWETGERKSSLRDVVNRWVDDDMEA